MTPSSTKLSSVYFQKYLDDLVSSLNCERPVKEDLKESVLNLHARKGLACQCLHCLYFRYLVRY